MKIDSNYNYSLDTETLKQHAFENLQKNGFKKNDIQKIENDKNYSKLMSINANKVYTKIIENISYLQDLGYSQSQIIHMVQNTPSIILYNKENIELIFQHFCQLGFSQEETIKITSCMPYILNKTTQEIDTQWQLYEHRGFKKEDIRNIIKNFPIAFGITPNKIESILEIFQSNTLSKDSSIKIISKFPILLSLSSKVLDKKINYIIHHINNVGFLIDVPHLLALPEEKLIEKIDFLKNIGIDITKQENISILNQDVCVTYSKYKFIANNRKKITTEEVELLKGKKFYMQYNISAIDLINKYPYHKNTVKIKEEEIEK